MLSARQATILKTIVTDYIASATPVASESMVRLHELKASPATIRNDMGHLESEGYIARPHISAGAVPTDKGYRWYVALLLDDETSLPAREQRRIEHQFRQVEGEMEEWVRLAAALLSSTVHNVAVVSLPKAAESRLKHLELLLIQEFLALMVLVLEEAKLKRQLIHLPRRVSQQELDTVANKVNSLYAGRGAAQIQAARAPDIEGQVVQAAVQMMKAEDQQVYDELYLEGLRHMLSQPEFAGKTQILVMVEMLEEKSVLRSLLPQVADDRVQVVIGGENKEDALRHCSLVVTRYGLPGTVGGALGVIGPTRMQYERAIPTVRYISSVMSQMVGGLYGEKVPHRSTWS